MAKVRIGTRSNAFSSIFCWCSQPRKLAKRPRRDRRHRVKFFLQSSGESMRNFGAEMGKWHGRTKWVSWCSSLGVTICMQIYLILIHVFVVFCHRYITEDAPLTTRPRAFTGALMLLLFVFDKILIYNLLMFPVAETCQENQAWPTASGEVSTDGNCL